MAIGPAAAVAAIACLAACQSSHAPTDGERLDGLVIPPAPDLRPIDVAKASGDPGELLRACRIKHRRVAETLGGHRFRARSTIEARLGEARLGGDAGGDALTVETSIDYRESGDYRGQVKNSKDYGREIVFTGGLLYLAPRHGKYHQRPPEDADEPARLRDELFSELAAHFELIVHGLEVSPSGEVRHAGRRGRKVAIALADHPRPPDPHRRSERAWRQSIRVLSAKGEIVLDADTGIPLEASISAEFAATREGRQLTVEASIDHAVSAIGEAVEIAAPEPERWVATPLRSRELEDRETLLRGIAPPAPRSRAGQGATRPAAPANPSTTERTPR